MKPQLTSTLFCAVLLAAVFSCSYRLIRVETPDGKHFWSKQYKDVELGERKEDQSVFKDWYNVQSHDRYSGNITSDTINGTTFVQFDSARIYLFDETSRYKNLFTSGLISSQLLYCTFNEDCKPVEPMYVITNTETGDTLVEDLWGWTGHTIRIEYFEELQHVHSKPTQRRFKFWVYPYKMRFNGSNSIFYIELTNENANRDTDLDTFIQGAKVTFIESPWSMI